MRRIPFTQRVLTTQAELESYGMSVGLKAAKMQRASDANYMRFVAEAYEEQIHQLTTMNVALAKFVGGLTTLSDEEEAEKAALVAQIQEFDA